MLSRPSHDERTLPFSRNHGVDLVGNRIPQRCPVGYCRNSLHDRGLQSDGDRRNRLSRENNLSTRHRRLYRRSLRRPFLRLLGRSPPFFGAIKSILRLTSSRNVRASQATISDQAGGSLATKAASTVRVGEHTVVSVSARRAESEWRSHTPAGEQVAMSERPQRQSSAKRIAEKVRGEGVPHTRVVGARRDLHDAGPIVIERSLYRQWANATCTGNEGRRRRRTNAEVQRWANSLWRRVTADPIAAGS
jgi:hypothetical protein